VEGGHSRQRVERDQRHQRVKEHVALGGLPELFPRGTEHPRSNVTRDTRGQWWDYSRPVC
jgi:hypothetical protein